ncbi:DUF2334 domain-containing protein [Conexibacter sp. DBS9H8]|uniref:DUF2334 domain-containing protein n=1 Tax=Conexibacter sp. DBS9H8 TaxID=2937801 RepID=UPI0020108042|nr:DUF2334 domain-containing protein [Conexibacter sp. DBS9H8]
MTDGPGLLAVTIYGIEPRTFAAARLMRRWLTARGVGVVTLAVVPAADRHPFATRSPHLAAWLRARVARGDAVAQHGFHPGVGDPEFRRRHPDDCAQRVLAGRRLMAAVELDAHGFIAPAYRYTPALRMLLLTHFDWFAERHHVQGTHGRLTAETQPLRGPLARVPPSLERAVRRARRSGAPVVRLDISPAVIEVPALTHRLERRLAGACWHDAVTYDGLCDHGRL